MQMTHAEWLFEGTKRFGPNQDAWRFVCPSCGFVASVQDWKDAGAEGAIAFACIGRWRPVHMEIFGKPGPCNYTGGGLFALNPVHVIFENGETTHVFDFALA